VRLVHGEPQAVLGAQGSIATVEFPIDFSIKESKRAFSGPKSRIMSKDAE
jgi:hypothetical protein